jgi:TonB family protein
MPFNTATELYSAREIARAAGVAEERVIEALGKADVLVPHAEAVRIGRSLIASAPRLHFSDPDSLFDIFSKAPTANRKGMPLALSGTVHGLAIVVVVLVTTLGLDPTATTLADSVDRPQPARLVFVVAPGPGGGGGGGGRLQMAPPPKAKREGQRSLSSPLPVRKPPPEIVPVAKPPEPAPPPPAPPEPLPPVVAPVVAAAADREDRPGVLEEVRAQSDSRGPGAGGGVGTGKGTGIGDGDGSGIGPGSGGGTGGGPYRPGSGVEPPRLITEVKPDYTDEARRRGIEGEVVMEIIVRRDGTVGDVKILQGLGSGLNDRAAQAVRRWRFAPARLKGTPVDVVVEASVEFRMR